MIYKAIKDIGNTLVAALDPNDSVGVIDENIFNAAFSRFISTSIDIRKNCERPFDWFQHPSLVDKKVLLKIG